MISVIINNYNYGKFISDAIESVINQTDKNYEIIIVDDGSLDNSRDVILKFCNRYPDKIKAIFKSNEGQASAINVGYSLAKGEIISFLDSDDYWYNNKLETIYEYHKLYDFVAHNKHYGDQNVPKFRFKFENQSQRLLKEYGRAYMYNTTTSSMSFSRNVLDKILPMPEKDFKVCADEYIMIFGMYFSNLKYIDKPLAYYRIHNFNSYFNSIDSEIMNVKNRVFNTIWTINKKLIDNKYVPIPYINNNLIKRMCELEENFIIESDREYVLYGTGNGARKLREYVEFCGSKIKYYSDSNEKKWQTEFENLTILSPLELINRRNEYYKIIISSMWIDDISEYLNKLGLNKDRDYIYSEIGFW